MAWDYYTACAARRFMETAMKYAHDQGMDYDEASCFIHNRIREFAEIVYPDSNARTYIEVKDIMHYSIDVGLELFKADFYLIMVVVYNEREVSPPNCNFTITGAFPVKKESE